jgi:hypothetical protein
LWSQWRLLLLLRLEFLRVRRVGLRGIRQNRRVLHRRDELFLQRLAGQRLITWLHRRGLRRNHRGLEFHHVGLRRDGNLRRDWCAHVLRLRNGDGRESQ